MLDHAGQVITRDQIADAIWPEAHGAVTAGMIDNAVTRLRRYLSNAHDLPEYIQTVRGVGYRLLQPVQ